MDPFIFDYDDPVWDKYSDALFRAAAAFPSRRGSFEINDARKKRDAELENLDRMCKNGDREACDKQAARGARGRSGRLVHEEPKGR